MEVIPQEVLEALLSLREPRIKTKPLEKERKIAKKCYYCHKSRDTEPMPCCKYHICPECAKERTKEDKMTCQFCKETITVIFKE